MGFHLRPAFWGRGLAEEAGRAIIAFAFETTVPLCYLVERFQASLPPSVSKASFGI